MIKIFFANHAQFEGRQTNLGDWAIFEQMYHDLKEKQIEDDNIEIIVPSLDPIFTNKKYQETTFTRGGIKGIVNTLKWLLTFQDTKTEIEVFGVNYERFALSELNKKLCSKLTINNVAELPALGTKAMPSLYSLGFGLAKKQVTLINGVEKSMQEWEKLNLKKFVTISRQQNIEQTSFSENSFDYVWNFVYIPSATNPDNLIEEMKRISKRYVAVFSVNGGNVGYYVHTALHHINKIPWTHGDKRYNQRKFVIQKFKEHGLRVIKTGFVDCPIWPDSIGFRDMRLHRNNITFDNVNWVSPYTDMTC